jgi:hypothetical protein
VIPMIKLRPLKTALSLLALATSAQGGTPACNRECLNSLADRLIASLATHTPGSLPLAATYAATEEGQPAALPMMTLWRTVTATRNPYYIIDPMTEQIFLIVTISEGANESLLYGRIKSPNGQLSEIELYTNRSRANGGFQFDAAGSMNFPDAWTVPVEQSRRASRAELLQAGRSIFDTGVPSPAIASTCVLMENGKIVWENPDVLKSIAPVSLDIARIPRNPDGTVQIPCGSPPERPTDKNARTNIIDEERGIVVSFATVYGMVEPYPVTDPTGSAFVPNSMLGAYTQMLKKQRDLSQYTRPSLQAMPAALTVAELYRI